MLDGLLRDSSVKNALGTDQVNLATAKGPTEKRLFGDMLSMSYKSERFSLSVNLEGEEPTYELKTETTLSNFKSLKNPLGLRTRSLTRDRTDSRDELPGVLAKHRMSISESSVMNALGIES